MTQGLGPSFARAVAAKDLSRVRELLHPELDFRAMTPTDRLTHLDERRARLQVKETGPGHGDRR